MFNTLYLQHELRLKHEMICETLFEILIHQKKSIVKYWDPNPEQMIWFM
jgi:hypothetical protein